MSLLVGTKIIGYTGYFGRDSYGDRRVEAVGVDWVVARNDDGSPEFASGPTIHDDLSKYTEKRA